MDLEASSWKDQEIPAEGKQRRHDALWPDQEPTGQMHWELAHGNLSRQTEDDGRADERW